MIKDCIIRVSLIALCVMLMLVSCSKTDNLLSLELPSPDPNSVSIDKAILKASSFVKSKGLLPQTKGTPNEIKEVFTIRDSEELPIVHVINFESGGFTLISADDRIDPVLAFSEKGSFPSSKKEYPLGLNIWMEMIAKKIQFNRNNNIQQSAIIKHLWDRTSDELIPTKSVPIDTTLTPPNVENRQIGPLLSTLWHQLYPYNYNLPTVSYNGSSRTAYVGCGPLSIAQIMRYHEFPNSFLWNQMPNMTTTPSSAISDLIYDIHDELYGTIAYSYFYTSLPPSFNFANFLKNTYGFSSASQSSYSYQNSTHRDIILSNLLDDETPVIFIGFISNNSDIGHVWICDGVISNHIVELIGGLYQVYHMIWYHHSWGDTDKSIDGWYYHDNYSVTDPESNQINLDHKMKFVYNIEP